MSSDIPMQAEFETSTGFSSGSKPSSTPSPTPSSSPLPSVKPWDFDEIDNKAFEFGSSSSSGCNPSTPNKRSRNHDSFIPRSSSPQQQQQQSSFDKTLVHVKVDFNSQYLVVDGMKYIKDPISQALLPVDLPENCKLISNLFQEKYLKVKEAEALRLKIESDLREQQNILSNKIAALQLSSSDDLIKSQSSLYKSQQNAPPPAAALYKSQYQQNSFSQFHSNSSYNSQNNNNNNNNRNDLGFSPTGIPYTGYCQICREKVYKNFQFCYSCNPTNNRRR